MKAKDWLDRGLDAQAAALRARTASERQSHLRNALDAFLAAASLGHPGAFLRLGFHYRDGEFGVSGPRPDLAEHWFRLAAAQTAAGMFELGRLLKHAGRKTEGQRWLRDALARGEGNAAYLLGREVEPKSKSRALRLFLQGAKLGDPYAAIGAAGLLEERDTREDVLHAAKLYKLAARKQGRDTDGDLARLQRKLDGIRYRSRLAAKARSRWR